MTYSPSSQTGSSSRYCMSSLNQAVCGLVRLHDEPTYCAVSVGLTILLLVLETGDDILFFAGFDLHMENGSVEHRLPHSVYCLVRPNKGVPASDFLVASEAV